MIKAVLSLELMLFNLVQWLAGFHLSANIEPRAYRGIYGSPPGKKSPDMYVSIKFDRGKITDTHCPCESSGSWCSHVIAVCLARIFLHEKCTFKPPLSDSLNNLKTYAQLRTFTQYLIAEFSDSRIIESAQDVLDRMLTPRSEQNDAINEIWGAPDPTAGPGESYCKLFHSQWKAGSGNSLYFCSFCGISLCTTQ